MKSNTNWTNYYNRKYIAIKANSMVEKFTECIFESKFEVYSNLKLSKKEISFIYRFSTHVAVNTFIERLIRVINYKNSEKIEYYKDCYYKNKYYKDSGPALVDYYNNFTLNGHLINKLSKTIYNNDNNLTIVYKKVPKKFSEDNHNISQRKFTSLVVIINKYLNILRKTKEFIFKLIFYNGLIHDNSPQMKLIHPSYLKISDYGYPTNRLNSEFRKKLRKNVYKISYITISEILNHLEIELSNNQKDKISLIFSEWYDHIIPLSYYETLESRFNYYLNHIKKWGIREVHSGTGYFFNDNFKIISIIAKRFNAKIIGHDHGVANYIQIYQEDNSTIPNYYKWINQLMFLDYYYAWGKYGKIIDDSWTGVDKRLNLKPKLTLKVIKQYLEIVMFELKRN